MDGVSNNPINYLKELVITIPDSRSWSQNLLKAFIDDPRVIKEKYKKIFCKYFFHERQMEKYVDYQQK